MLRQQRDHFEMDRSPDRIELTLYHDVLCGWSWLTEKRLLLLREEFGSHLRIRRKPFAVRPDDRLPSKWECMAEASAWRKVGQERDGKGIIPDLWKSSDPPTSSLPPLVALQAASIVGGNRAVEKLIEELRNAAFYHGINISRDDVILEIAERSGLPIPRFANAYYSEQARRSVLAQHDDALARGIDSVPTLIIGDEWLLAGARSIEEYRSAIRRYAQQQGLRLPRRSVH